MAEASKPEPAPMQAPKPQLASADSAQVFLSPSRPHEATAAIAPGPTPTTPSSITPGSITAGSVAPGSNAPITPLKVKTVAVKLVPPKIPPPTAPTAAAVAKSEPVRTAAFAPPTQDETLAETLAAAAPIEVAAPSAPSPASAPATHRGVLNKLPALVAAAKQAAVPSAKADEAPIPRRTTRSGWAIQVGAYEDEGEAKQHLSTAKSKITRVLEKAEAYIERTVKGAKTYYRARFAGFDRDQAEAVCKRLKREDVACMALKI
jgi:D-alanyl-D-alanine carboxypeptidase